MAPSLQPTKIAPGFGCAEVKQGIGRRQAKKGRAHPRPRSALVLLDILDDLGHVVLVFAEFGGILKQLLVLFLAFFER
jgi:hypothetical protein